MRSLILATTILLGGAAHADGMPPVPADYPSHLNVGNCDKQALNDGLQRYNETRLQLAAILREMAKEPTAAGTARQRLIGYADSLDEMRRELPPPDPDSPVFRNFDFRLGMVLTSMTLFLHTEDEHLAARFQRDRDDPQSELGLYLARLDVSREQYMNRLEATRTEGCRG